MRRLAPLLLVALAVPAAAQKVTVMDLAHATAGTAISLKQLMTSELGDPKVQIAIGVTPTQYALQALRMDEEVAKIGYRMTRSTYEDGDKAQADFAPSFDNLNGSCLYPYLSDGQLAKLRRLTLKDSPAYALTTPEVAFALDLSESQKTRIATLRVESMKANLNPSRPSVRALNEGFAKVQALTAQAKPEDANESDEDSIARIDLAQKATLELLHAMQKAVRLAAKEKDIVGPDPTTLLTAAQRRRFRELTGETRPVASVRRSLVAKRR